MLHIAVMKIPRKTTNNPEDQNVSERARSYHRLNGPANFLIPRRQGQYLVTEEVRVHLMLIAALVEIPLLPLKVQILIGHAKTRIFNLDIP